MSPQKFFNLQPSIGNSDSLAAKVSKILAIVCSNMRAAPTGTAKYGTDIDTRKAGLIWARVIATSWIPPHKMIVKMAATDMRAVIVSHRRSIGGMCSMMISTAMCWPRLTATADPNSEDHTRQ